MDLKYKYEIMEKGILKKKGMCTDGFKSGYETLYSMGLINNIKIKFEKIVDNLNE